MHNVPATTAEVLAGSHNQILVPNVVLRVYNPVIDALEMALNFVSNALVAVL